MTDSDLLRPLARGHAALSETLWAAASPQVRRRVQYFTATLAPILSAGTWRDGLPASGGLRASEWHTRERGAAVFVENPTDRTLTGSVFPAIESLTLAPGEVRAWVHDFPIGASASYLGAYAGLVKCDACLLCAHLRPDPFVGARVFVWDAIGATREVALFGGGRGEGAAVTVSADPQTVVVAESEVLVLSPELAGALWLPEAPETRADMPTLLGTQWLLWPDGTLQSPPRDGRAVEDAPAGWLWTEVNVPAAAGARLDLGGDASALGALFVNGAPADPADLTLDAGRNVLLVHAVRPLPQPLLVPDGACYLLELNRWRSCAAGAGER